MIFRSIAALFAVAIGLIAGFSRINFEQDRIYFMVDQILILVPGALFLLLAIHGSSNWGKFFRLVFNFHNDGDRQIINVLLADMKKSFYWFAYLMCMVGLVFFIIGSATLGVEIYSRSNTYFPMIFTVFFPMIVVLSVINVYFSFLKIIRFKNFKPEDSEIFQQKNDFSADFYLWPILVFIAFLVPHLIFYISSF